MARSNKIKERVSGLINNGLDNLPGFVDAGLWIDVLDSAKKRTIRIPYKSAQRTVS